MTIVSSGALRLSAFNTEFSKGNDIANYHGVKFYKPSTSTLSNFSSGLLHFSDFYGTQNGITINITISSDSQNITISPSNGSISPTYVAGFTTINITINNGIYVGSSSTGTYALTVTGFSSGDTINIINNGVIIGAGGAGGNSANNANGSPGNPGGNALLLQYATNITNNGTVAGGGGGGGAQNGGHTYGSCLGGGSSYTGQGGGGGAGYTVGSGGSGSPSGSSGTRTAGGNGAATGGGPGLSGASSDQAGGSAGYYITGLSYANFITSGTLLGLSS